MQLMQQKVQKSRMTTLPRRSRRRKGLAVLSQFTPPWSSGARIRPSRGGSSALAAAPPLFSAGAWSAAGLFFSGAETSAAAFAGFSCNRPQPNKLPDANNTTTAISTTSRRPGTVDICVLLDRVRKRPSKVPSVLRLITLSADVSRPVLKDYSGHLRPLNVSPFVIRLGSPILRRSPPARTAKPRPTKLLDDQQ